MVSGHECQSHGNDISEWKSANKAVYEPGHEENGQSETTVRREQEKTTKKKKASFGAQCIHEMHSSIKREEARVKRSEWLHVAVYQFVALPVVALPAVALPVVAVQWAAAPAATFRPGCSMPCTEYDGSYELVSVDETQVRDSPTIGQQHGPRRNEKETRCVNTDAGRRRRPFRRPPGCLTGGRLCPGEDEKIKR